MTCAEASAQARTANEGPLIAVNQSPPPCWCFHSENTNKGEMNFFHAHPSKQKDDPFCHPDAGRILGLGLRASVTIVSWIELRERKGTVAFLPAKFP
jgi:hypothetical protein